jgi:anti-sigma28 factor (negative regulator of flagellin synthesis)
MRIYDRNLTGTAAAESGRAQKTDRFETGSAGGAAGSGGDRVELSSTLGRLAKVLGADHSDRASKVAALAAQYQSGNYRSNPAAISRGMVTDAISAGSQAK